jgi:phage repressor protein C with HTH and peptisase S24 domain
MFRLITTKLLAYVCGGLLIALAVTGGFAGCEHSNANAARAERDAANAALDTAVDANKSNQATIATQKAALDEWASLGLSPAEILQALKSVGDALKEAGRTLDAWQAEKEKERANPDCGAWLRASFQRACPGLARGLRNAASGHADGDGQGAGAGGEAAAGPAHDGLRPALPVPGG